MQAVVNNSEAFQEVEEYSQNCEDLGFVVTRTARGEWYQVMVLHLEWYRPSHDGNRVEVTNPLM